MLQKCVCLSALNEAFYGVSKTTVSECSLNMAKYKVLASSSEAGAWNLYLTNHYTAFCYNDIANWNCVSYHYPVIRSCFGCLRRLIFLHVVRSFNGERTCGILLKFSLVLVIEITSYMRLAFKTKTISYLQNL